LIRASGSGKTVAFLLPVLLMLLERPLARKFHYTKSFPLYLILAPTRELAVQIYDSAKKVPRSLRT
jgi:superfamily II DNA/RNA helicase